MNICSNPFLRFFDIRAINERFSLLFKEVCYLKSITSPTLQLKGYKFANLPTGVNGMIARVTDSNVDAWGAEVAGGDSINVLAFYNGSTWTVFAK